MTRLLLLSNSTTPGAPYLGWARPHIEAFLGDVRELLFIPYAGVQIGWDDYTARVADALVPLGVRVRGVHRTADAATAVRDAGAILVGGGNTFHLLKHLQDAGLIGPVRERVAAGAPYVGWSAGANVACPTIRTTNDMPIVEPAGFRALALVPFQINAHYTEATLPNHGGETRPQRIGEFVAANPGVWVVGLPEGAFLRAEGDELRLGGDQPATVFAHGREPVRHEAGAVLTFLRRPPERG